MNTIKFFPVILVCLILQACPNQYSEEPDLKFIIKNNTDKNIFFYANTVDTLVCPKNFIQDNLTLIKNNKSFSTDFWSILFESKQLNILIYKQSTLDSYSWKEIQDANLFDKRYVLTLDELKAMNYIVVYNGE